MNTKEEIKTEKGNKNTHTHTHTSKGKYVYANKKGNFKTKIIRTTNERKSTELHTFLFLNLYDFVRVCVCLKKPTQSVNCKLNENKWRQIKH